MALDPETLNQLLDSVRDFVRGRLLPLEQQVAEEDHIPEAVIEEMKDIGLFGLSIPHEYGGLGLTMEEGVVKSQQMRDTFSSFLKAIERGEQHDKSRTIKARRMAA